MQRANERKKGAKGKSGKKGDKSSDRSAQGRHLRHCQAQPALGGALVQALVGGSRRLGELRMVAESHAAALPWRAARCTGCTQWCRSDRAGSLTWDPNHGLPADYEFHPVLIKASTDDEVREGIRRSP